MEASLGILRSCDCDAVWMRQFHFQEISQNHRVIWVGRELKSHLSPPAAMDGDTLH